MEVCEQMDLSEGFISPQFSRENSFLVGGFFILILLLMGAYGYYQLDIYHQEKSYDVNATILEGKEDGRVTAGIAAGHGLSFGKFNSVFNKTKSLNLSSRNTALVKVSSEGNISNKLNYREKHFFEGKTQIPIEMSVNESGYFNGTVKLDIKVARSKWGEGWLELLYRYS